jgi:hypothetical protein
MRGEENKERRELMLLFSFPRPSLFDTSVRQPTLDPLLLSTTGLPGHWQ